MNEWAVVVVQLVERLLHTPVIHSSNPVINKYYLFSTVLACVIEKTIIMKKRPSTYGPIKNKKTNEETNSRKQSTVALTKDIFFKMDFIKFCR